MNQNDSNLQPSRMAGESDQDSKQRSNSRELSDHAGFEDATDCPSCQMVRPFGGDCPRCGWTPGEEAGSGTGSAATGADSSLTRLVFVIASGSSEPIATAKASAALSHRDNAMPASELTLVEDYADPDQLFPGKWGEIKNAISRSSDQADEILDQIRTTLQRDDFPAGSEEVPLVYGEDGSIISSQSRLDKALTGGVTTVGAAGQDSLWLVPAVLSEPSPTSSTSTSSPETRSIRCHDCGHKTPHTYQGDPTGEDSHPDRTPEHIWTCNECGCGHYDSPPAE